MSKNLINENWRMLPFFYGLHNDSVFDYAYVFKGLTFILSLIIAPLTIPLWSVGKILEIYAK